MKIAYLDTSYVLAILFGERGATEDRAFLKTVDRAVSDSLLVAEVLSAAKREGIENEVLRPGLSTIDLLFPQESQVSFLERIFAEGFLRGADAFHLATALWFAGERCPEVYFLSRDRDQKRTAERLGFRVR